MDKLDRHLTNVRPPLAHREALAAAALSRVRLAARLQRTRQLLNLIFIVVALLFVAKCWNNQLPHLLWLGLTNGRQIASDWPEYQAALIVALPIWQLGVTIALGFILLTWRRLETFVARRRITSINKEPMMRLIKSTSTTAAVVGLSVFAIGASTVALATKLDPAKLGIVNKFVNQSGHTQLDTNLSANRCSLRHDPTLTNKYQIKKDANVSTEDAEQIITAACQQAHAAQFLGQKYPANTKPALRSDGGIDFMENEFAYRVVSLEGRTLTLQPLHYPQSEPAQTFDVTDQTGIYQWNERKATAAALRPGSLVVAATQHRWGNGNPTKPVLHGLYLLPATPTAEWYAQAKQTLVVPIHTCMGNSQDTCTFTGGVDLFPAGSEGATNPAARALPNSEAKEIAGAITAIRPHSVDIKTSSGRSFTINYPSDPVSYFNQHLSANYNNAKVEIGDSIMTWYSETKGQHNTTINAEQIHRTQLIIEFFGKSDPIKKY
jgi:hypothetical protein